MLNSVVLMGRLTRDPELRHTQSGLPVASFSLAVERDTVNKETGTKGVDFIDCVAWRQTAEYVSKYFTKGRMAVVTGRLQVRDYTDQNGSKRRAVEVIAQSVYFGDSKKDADSTAQTTQAQQTTAGANNDGFTEIDDDDSDLPF